MKRGFIFAGSAVLALAICSSSSANSRTARTRVQDLVVSATAQQQTRQPAEEFQGTIEKTGTKYVLDDKASGATYQLDNQDKAKQFADKDVKVTGTLDPSTNTIQVSEIEEAK
jgi:hypothetical protein